MGTWLAECYICGESEGFDGDEVEEQHVFYINRFTKRTNVICERCVSKLQDFLLINDNNRSLIERTNSLEKMMQDHAIGVQRVYDEMQKLVARVVKLENYEGEEEEEEIELMRCPFCDGEAELSDIGLSDYQIACSDCSMKTETFDDKDNALSYWNFRP